MLLGTNGELRATADANFVINPSTAFRFQLLGEGTETYRDEINNDQIGFAPSFRFGIGTDLDVTLQYEYLQTKTKTDYGQPNLGAVFGYAMPPVSLKQYYGFANYDFTNLHTNIATASVNWKVSDTVGLRNVTRWAGYRREMEATIGGLNATTLGGTPVTASTPYDQLAATLTHNKARDNDDSVFINQTDVTWKVATGAMKHTVTGGLDLAWERLKRTTYAFDGRSRHGQGRGAVDRHPLPQPGHRRVAQLHGHPAGPQHFQGRHHRRIRAGPDRSSRRNGRPCSACATTTMTRARSRPR